MADGRMARRPPPRDRRDGAAARTPDEYRQPYIPPQPGPDIPEPYATPEPPPGPTRGAPYRRRGPDDTGGWRRDPGSGARGAAPVPPRQYLHPDALGGGAPAGWPENGYGAPTPPGGYGSYGGEYDGYGEYGEYGEYGPPGNGYGRAAPATPGNGYGPAAPATPGNGYGPAAPTNGYGPAAPQAYGPAAPQAYGPPEGSREYGTPSGGFGPASGYGPPTNGYEPNGYEPNGYEPNGYEPNGYRPPAGDNGYGPPGERTDRHTGEFRRPPADDAERGRQTGEFRRPPTDPPSQQTSEFRRPPAGTPSRHPGEFRRPPTDASGRHTGEFRRPPADPSGAATDGYGFRRPRDYGTSGYGQPPGYGPPPNGYDGYDGRDRYEGRPGRRDDGRPHGDQHAEWISRGGSDERVTPHETGRWSASRGSWIPTDPPRENAPDFAIGRFEETGDVRRGPGARRSRVVDGVGWSERMDQRPEWHPHTWDDAPTGRSTDWSEVPLPPPRPRTAEPWMRGANTPSERDPDADRLVGDAVPAGTLGAVLAPLIWFALAVGAYLVAVMLLNDGGERATAIQVAIDSLPWLGVASTMSVGVSLTLRWIGAGWRAAGLGFAAAVVSGTVITVLHSLLAG